MIIHNVSQQEKARREGKEEEGERREREEEGEGAERGEEGGSTGYKRVTRNS